MKTGTTTSEARQGLTCSDLFCHQCGEDTPELFEGYCEECRDERQRELHDHNFRFDRWEGLTDQQRSAEIKNVIF